MIRLVQKSVLYAMLVLCTVLIAGAAGAVDEIESRRVAASLAIFPRIVAVDAHIEDKVDIDGVLHLAIVYVVDQNFAIDQAKKLADAVPNIAGRPVKAHPLPLSDLSAWYKAPLGGILISEKLSENQLGEILSEAKRNHLIIFSPFAGDVERGAMAGLAVGSQIKPYFNVRSLREAQVEINPVLLRMSKQYE